MVPHRTVSRWKYHRNGYRVTRTVPVHGSLRHRISVRRTSYKNMSVTVSWSVEETLALLAIWSDGTIQDQLGGMKRNEKVFQAISEFLAARGFQRTSKQCRDKIKKLKYTYRMQRENRNRTAKRADRLYEALDRVLGSPLQLVEGAVDDQHDLKPESPGESSNHGGNSASETSAPSPVPAPTQRVEPPPELQDPLITTPLDHRPHTSNPRYTGNASYARRSILGKRRHQQSIHTEFLAYLRESDTAHLALLEAQHRQWMESREADRATEAVQAAERLRVDETFNNQFISVFGQFVQVLRETRTRTPVHSPPD